MATNAVIRSAEPADRSAVESLLDEADLPLEGVAEALDDFLVALEDGRVIGAVGLETYGELGLLRSAVVDPRVRSTGVGSELTEAVIRVARDRDLRQLYLLTTTAEAFFARFGFERIERDETPPEIRSSAEFASVCPDDAIAMVLDL